MVKLLNAEPRNAATEIPGPPPALIVYDRLTVGVNAYHQLASGPKGAHAPGSFASAEAPAPDCVSWKGSDPGAIVCASAKSSPAGGTMLVTLSVACQYPKTWT